MVRDAYAVHPRRASLAVITARTPGIASAAETSSATMRAEQSDRSTAACRMRGAVPVDGVARAARELVAGVAAGIVHHGGAGVHAILLSCAGLRRAPARRR